MVEFFEILSGFENTCFLMSFWLGKKSVQKLKYRGFGRLIEKRRLVLEGSAGEAVRRGGERGGVMLPESIQLRVQHAVPQVAADLYIYAASSADL